MEMKVSCLPNSYFPVEQEFNLTSLPQGGGDAHIKVTGGGGGDCHTFYWLECVVWYHLGCCNQNRK